MMVMTMIVMLKELLSLLLLLRTGQDRTAHPVVTPPVLPRRPISGIFQPLPGLLAWSGCLNEERYVYNIRVLAYCTVRDRVITDQTDKGHLL